MAWHGAKCLLAGLGMFLLFFIFFREKNRRVPRTNQRRPPSYQKYRRQILGYFRFFKVKCSCYGRPRLALTQTYSHLLCLALPKEHVPANWQPKQRRKSCRGTTTQRSQPSQALLVIPRKTVTQVQSGVRWRRI